MPTNWRPGVPVQKPAANALPATTAGSSAPPMKVSDHGINLIKTFEQLRLKAYRDVAGHWTIGYGHLIQSNEHFISITPEQANELLEHDLAPVATALNSAVTVPLTQCQFDALASLVFNIGISAFKTSTLLKLLNAGNYSGAASQFLRWDKATINGAFVEQLGLRRRRQLEEAIFLGHEEAC